MSSNKVAISTVHHSLAVPMAQLGQCQVKCMTSSIVLVAYPVRPPDTNAKPWTLLVLNHFHHSSARTDFIHLSQLIQLPLSNNLFLSRLLMSTSAGSFLKWCAHLSHWTRCEAWLISTLSISDSQSISEFIQTLTPACENLCVKLNKHTCHCHLQSNPIPLYDIKCH